MVTRRLGRNGPEITILGFGTWAMSGPYEFGWGPVDDEDSTAAIRRAIEAGVNWVDTAPIYGFGHAEEVIGRALAPFRAGDDVLVFTKCGRRWQPDDSRGEIRGRPANRTPVRYDSGGQPTPRSCTTRHPAVHTTARTSTTRPRTWTGRGPAPTTLNRNI